MGFGNVSRIVALTGATGFIGRAVARDLHRAGWSIRALVRSQSKAQVINACISESVLGSLDDIASLRRLFQNAYAVVHCAGAVRGVTQSQFDAVNAQGVARVVAAALGQSVKPRVLVLSSLAAREPGLSAYAASKRKGEEILRRQAEKLEWSALRPPAVYGPGDRELLPLFRTMGKGFAPIVAAKGARFSMLHVSDLAAAVRQWLGRDRCKNGVYELHDGHPGGYSWPELLALVSTLCGKKVRPIAVPPALVRIPAGANWLAGLLFGYLPMLTPGKLRELTHPDWVCDNQAFTAETGWTPMISLEDGLRGMPGWAGFKEN